MRANAGAGTHPARLHGPGAASGSPLSQMVLEGSGGEGPPCSRPHPGQAQNGQGGSAGQSPPPPLPVVPASWGSQPHSKLVFKVSCLQSIPSHQSLLPDGLASA